MKAEIYQGVKFSTLFVSKSPPESIYFDELKQWCQYFHKHNLAPPYDGGSSGNLSFREKQSENSFIITGSKIGLKDNLSDEKFVRVHSCHPEKNTVYASGKIEPSSESMLHYMIYRTRKDVQAIFHGHSAKILKYSNELMLPVSKKEAPYGTIELANSIMDLVVEHNAVILKNHGFIVLGSNMEDAGKKLLEIVGKCSKFK